MRPSSYRVWDKDLNQWVNLETQSVTLAAHYQKTHTRYSISTVNGKPVGQGRTVNMQYTGLFDELGDEICEGDICYAFKKGSALNGYYKVIWDSLRGRWAYLNGTAIERYQVGKAGNIHCKIIGNEFDTPTLNNIWHHN